MSSFICSCRNKKWEPSSIYLQESTYRFSGHFDMCSSTPITLPRINIGADVWGKLGIMTGVIIADARLLCTWIGSL